MIRGNQLIFKVKLRLRNSFISICNDLFKDTIKRLFGNFINELDTVQRWLLLPPKTNLVLFLKVLLLNAIFFLFGGFVCRFLFAL